MPLSFYTLFKINYLLNSTITPGLIQVNQYCQKLIILVALVCAIVSCKKSTPENNNEFKASVVFANGETINYSESGAKAKMGCSIWSTFTHVGLNNSVNATFGMSVISQYNPSTYDFCVTIPGTYNCTIDYYKNGSYSSVDVFSGKTNECNVTFTMINADHMEGSFSGTVTCNGPSCQSTTAVISGTFKGRNGLF